MYFLDGSLAVDFGFALEISLDMRDAKSMFAVSIVELGLKRRFDAKTIVQSSSDGRANLLYTRSETASKIFSKYSFRADMFW